jgi:hypothetical protein
MDVEVAPRRKATHHPSPQQLHIQRSAHHQNGSATQITAQTFGKENEK